jgi:hypothetical protein
VVAFPSIEPKREGDGVGEVAEIGGGELLIVGHAISMEQNTNKGNGTLP